jgi:GT2 family glycosyltransferase
MLKRLRRIVRHIRFRTASLEGSLPSSLEIGAPVTASLVVPRHARLLVNVSWNTTHDVLSGITSPTAHQSATPARAAALGSVTLTVTATDGVAGPELARSALVMAPSDDTSGTHDSVRVMVLDLPARPASDIVVTFHASLSMSGSAATAATTTAGSITLSEARLTWPRTLREMQTLFAAVRARDGLTGAMRRAVQASTQFDRDADYRRWLARHRLTPDTTAALATMVDTLDWHPVITVLTPVFNTDPRLLRECVASVTSQIYPHWQLVLVDDASTRPETREVLQTIDGSDPRICVVWRATNGHISRASNDGLAAATGDFIALLDHDDTLAPEALALVAQRLAHEPDLDFIYTDEDKLDVMGGRCDPYFKPDWSPDHFLNFMYTNHLMVLRRSLVSEVGGFREGYEGSQDYDLALRVITRTSRVGHVPHVLYHWRQIEGSTAAGGDAKPWAHQAARRALEDHVARTEPDSEVVALPTPGLFRVVRPVRGTPRVSLVIPSADLTRVVNGRRVRLLAHLLNSVAERTTYRNLEVVVCDNGTMCDESRTALERLPHVLHSYSAPPPFNFAHKLNVTASHASGDYLLLLNDDIEVVTPGWIEAMLEYAQDPNIGAVGTRLLYPDGRLQHIGVLMGVGGIAGHAFHQHPGDHPGYFGSARGVRNYSAVTAACMMTHRRHFDALGGFDERLAIDFNDIDYCLRLRRHGLRVVYTPYAELIHLESSSMPDRQWYPDAVQHMRSVWGHIIDNDPCYNPNLTRQHADYRLRD